MQTMRGLVGLRALLLLCVALLCVALPASLVCSALADDTTSSMAPVKVIADRMLPVKTAKGEGELPVYVSVDGKPADVAKPHPEVVRALIIFHGKLRNADVYNQSGLTAIKTAAAAGKGTLLIAPQFLAEVDAQAFHLAPGVLRWAPEAWMSGDNSLNAPVSSFDAMDAILEQLGNKTVFPNLKSVVMAGHSGGGQVMQRYAVVGKGGDALMRLGVHVRYVVANPSSYVYFSPERPVLDPKGDYTFAIPKKSCFAKYDNWKYGVNDPPPYVGDASFKEMEERFVRRDVIFLLGTNDVDPNHPALDKSCSGEDEGPYRFFRGKAFFKYMELRHPELEKPSASQQLWFVPGVEHDGEKMLNSACGLTALFGTGTCTTRELEPKP